jgi:predicted PP-loop superfamily ATPase
LRCKDVVTINLGTQLQPPDITVVVSGMGLNLGYQSISIYQYSGRTIFPKIIKGGIYEKRSIVVCITL